MSGEFGNVWGSKNSYLWQCLQNGVDDYTEADDEMTRKVGELLKGLTPLVTAIAYWKACDSGQEYPMETLIDSMSKIKELTEELEQIQKPWAGLVKEAKEKVIKECAAKA